MDNQTLANLVGYAAATIGSIMFIPQAYEIWKTQETKGVSLKSFVLLGVVSVLWMTYGILLQATPIIIVNTVITVLSGYIIYMKLKHK